MKVISYMIFFGCGSCYEFMCGSLVMSAAKPIVPVQGKKEKNLQKKTCSLHDENVRSGENRKENLKKDGSPNGYFCQRN